MGYAGIIYANAALQASLRATSDLLGYLRANGSLAGRESMLVSFDERQRTINYAHFQAMEKRFSV
jgi:2-methylisocitrate lyase-like PEP mutase family enzyme